MDWYESVFELIDMRSFSNLWFWIALAVFWSSTSHWVLGVPWDVAQRARKDGNGQGVIDFEDLVRIYTNRILYIVETSGLLLAAFTCFILTVLVLLGFVYGREFAQALFLLGLPMSIVGLMSIRTARRIKREGLRGEMLYKRLYRHRIQIQALGIVSIFITAMWGMLQNLSVSALGG